MVQISYSSRMDGNTKLEDIPPGTVVTYDLLGTRTVDDLLPHGRQASSGQLGTAQDYSEAASIGGIRLAERELVMAEIAARREMKE